MYKCSNCSYEGDKLSKKEEGAMHDDKCPVCGDEVILKAKPLNSSKPIDNIDKLNLDLNNDGVIDSKDASIASKVMNKVRKNKKKKHKR